MRVTEEGTRMFFQDGDLNFLRLWCNFLLGVLSQKNYTSLIPFMRVMLFFTALPPYTRVMLFFIAMPPYTLIYESYALLQSSATIRELCSSSQLCHHTRVMLFFIALPPYESYALLHSSATIPGLVNF